MPTIPPDDNRCTANLKTCPANRGGCGYRYVKGDAKWQDGGKCPQCGFDRRCGRPPVKGHHVCDKHGMGAVRKGRSAIKAKSDLLTPDLPKRMLETYHAALNDQRLYHLQSDISILETRKHELIKRAKKNDSPQFRAELKTLSKQFKEAQSTGKVEEMKIALDSLFSLIDKGYTEDTAWEKMEETIQRKANLLDREFKNLESAGRVIRIEQFMAEVAKLLGIIKKRLGQDSGEYRLIMGDIYQLLNKDNPNPDVSLPLIIDISPDVDS